MVFNNFRKAKYGILLGILFLAATPFYQYIKTDVAYVYGTDSMKIQLRDTGFIFDANNDTIYFVSNVIFKDSVIYKDSVITYMFAGVIPDTNWVNDQVNGIYLLLSGGIVTGETTFDKITFDCDTILKAGGNDTLDFGSYNCFDLTITSNIDSLEFKDGTAGTYSITIKQDGTGGYTCNFGDNNFLFEGGSETINTNANDVTVISCRIREDNTDTAYCTILNNFE
jgi:hypothetical protein